MTTEEPERDESGGQASEHDEDPVIEDAYEPQEIPSKVPEEDAPELLSGLSRVLQDQPEDTENVDAAAIDASKAAALVAQRDDASDTEAISDGTDDGSDVQSLEMDADWESELSAHKVVVFLKRIETEVRSLLEGVDDKRKRKLSGSRRWRELEEDLISWQHLSRIDQAVLKRLMQLVARRDYLFRRLIFLSGTRQVWNS